MRLSRYVRFATIGLVLSGCTNDSPTGLADDVTVTELETPTAAVYSGSRGLVIDTREIFRKGYKPTSVKVEFRDYPRLNTELEVDPLTNLSFVVIENDSLTEAEQAAFANSVATTITVYGESFSGGTSSGASPAATEHALTTFSGPQALDASNRPVHIDDPDLPDNPPPLRLNPSVPHILVEEGVDGALSRGVGLKDSRDDSMEFDLFRLDQLKVDDAGTIDESQEFYFEPVAGEANTYYVRHDTLYLQLCEVGPDPDPRYPGETRCAGFRNSSSVHFYLGEEQTREKFVLVEAEDGFVKIRHADTGDFVGRKPFSTEWALFNFADESKGRRFRLLLSRVEWTIRDLGTAFNQPIVPPARLAFANQSTIRNCSAAQVNEVIGRTQTKSQTTSFGTSESLQIFQGRETTHAINWSVGAELNFSPPEVTGGVGGRVSMEVGGQHEWSITTSSTRVTETYSQFDVTEEVEIARSREVSVPPFSAVTASDWVRILENVVIPWTKSYKLTARDAVTGTDLSGDQIVTQLQFNFVGALRQQVGPDFVVVTVRGTATTDHFYQSESTVADIPNACN